MTLPIFQYNEQLRGREIRLIRLNPAAGANGTLEIHLEVFALDNAEYNALSYVWGDQNEQIEIICNGQKLYIGRNLHDALVARRMEKVDGFMYDDGVATHSDNYEAIFQSRLWADAICINQSDMTEKTYQVRLMKDIYLQAQRVDVWLGQELEGDFQAFDFATWLYDKLYPRFEIFDITKPDLGPLSDIAYDFPGLLQYPTWKNNFQLLSHPWFTRIWIVQEITLSRSAFVQRGRLLCPVDIILWFALLPARCSDIEQLARNFDCASAATLAQYYHRYRKTGPIPLCGWAKSCYHMDATDIRDKLFALVGISHSVHPTFIDYTSGFREIAMWVGAEALLGNPAWPELLYGLDNLAFAANPRNRELGIPSWVPDYFSKKDRGGLDMTWAFRSQALGDGHDPFAHTDMRGLRLANIDLPNEHTTRLTYEIFDSEIAFKASQIDTIDSVLREVPSKHREDSSRKLVDFADYSSIASGVRENLQVAYAARRFANPSLTPTSDINSGSDIDDFVSLLCYNYDPGGDATNLQMTFSFGYWIMWCLLFLQCFDRKDIGHFEKYGAMIKELAAPFEAASSRFNSRVLFKTTDGKLGWAPLRAQEGSKIFIFQGSRIPFLAESADGDSWEYVGPCYVHGLMDGEAWHLAKNKWFSMKLV